MLKERVEAILNEQVSKEGYSSYLYLSMATWAETQGLEGVAEWLYAQAEEEKTHMLKFARFINERGGKTSYASMPAPPSDWEDLFVLFEEVLKHEQFISESIHNILDIAIEEKDYAVQNWIQWFVTEQIEEESSVQAILDKLNLLDKGKSSLYMFNKDIQNMRGE